MQETTQQLTEEGITEYLKVRGNLSNDGTLDLSSVMFPTHTMEDGYQIFVGEYVNSTATLLTKDFVTASIVPIYGVTFFGFGGSIGASNGKYFVNADNDILCLLT